MEAVCRPRGWGCSAPSGFSLWTSVWALVLDPDCAAALPRVLRSLTQGRVVLRVSRLWETAQLPLEQVSEQVHAKPFQLAGTVSHAGWTLVPAASITRVLRVGRGQHREMLCPPERSGLGEMLS